MKKIFSYFYDFPLEKKQSRYSGEVIVSYNKGQYKLSTKNAIYSFGKNYSSFDIAFKSIGIRQIKTERVLVLGFGLGSIVDLLENHPAVKSITAVDADEVIIKLARKYLQSNLKNNVSYICEDAEKFVINTSDQFDLILFDVFIDDLTPVQFMQKKFLAELKKLLAKDGILIYSKIDDSQKSKIENAQFEQNFSEVFPKSFTIEADGNKMFCWFNSEQ